MNNPNAWLQLALYVGALLLITKPLGLYLMQVLDARGRTWLDRVVKPFERLTYSRLRDRSRRGAGLEGLHDLAADLQPGGHARDLLHPALPGPPPAQSAGASRPRAAPRVQHRGQLHDQHQLAELRRRIHHVVLLADGGAGHPQFLLRRRRHRRRGRARARHRAAVGARPSAISGSISCAITYYLLLPICIVFALFLVSQGMIQNFKPYTTAKLIEPYTIQVPKIDANGKPVMDAEGKPVHGRSDGRHADHRAGPDGLAGRDQDARHQRRRLHERQRRASVRESDAALQLLPDALHLRHPAAR